jgi:hypothetical protein
MSQEPTSDALIILWPEFCDSDVYGGWHLYEREQVDRVNRLPIPNASLKRYGPWGWIRGHNLRHAYDMAVLAGAEGLTMPEPLGY